ncbi:hypothetical protein N7495_001535 [Penicillium taxi]|uniref:uncharacterized protein n=1 Tax=Penicillium taxi TaxID=168475 RepID=UPI002544F05E|nr:uncharacterized protein N7495_001535 [Penicillium taxi]KAJ5908853.1 hypothetical protein N7495_001535 [Penicillium taxi]
MRPFTPQGLRPLRLLLPQSPKPIVSTRAALPRLFSSKALQNPISTPTARQRHAIPSIYRSKSTYPRLTEDAADTQTDAERERQNAERRAKEEAYQVTFTCKPCGERSTHRMSKQGYHRGTVLIQCPSCESRHVMSDHLGIFFDKGTTLEDLLKEKGQVLTHGRTDGDMEFWDDGSVNKVDENGARPFGTSGKESS